MEGVPLDPKVVPITLRSLIHPPACVSLGFGGDEGRR